MEIVTEHLEFTTHGNAECIDITSRIGDILEKTGFQDGLVTVFVPGATGALTTLEYESGLVEDLENLWERIIPHTIAYHHDRTWGDGNGHSHVRASLLGPSLSIPFSTGTLTLGTWQQIVFIDFDNRSRSRKLVVQCIGE